MTNTLGFSMTEPGSKNPLARLDKLTKRTPPNLTANALAKERGKKILARRRKLKELSRQRPRGVNEPVRHIKKEVKIESLRSQMERFLRGETLPKYEDRGEVKRVKKSSGMRIVEFEDGSIARIPRKKMVKLFNLALRSRGYKNAMKSVTKDKKTGRIKVRIGGKKQGVEHEFNSVDRAKKAIKKAYGQ